MIYLFICFLLKTNYSYASNHIKNYKCKINFSTSIKNISPLEMSAPKEIKIKYNSETNSLVEYIWNYESVINDFELMNNKSNSEFIEIARKGFKKTLSNKDIRNGIYFKLYFNDLKANLSKQFIRPVNYKCF